MCPPPASCSWPFRLPDRGPAAEIVCVGHALLDRLAETPPEVVAAAGLEPGAMTLVDAGAATRIEQSWTGWREVAGGSAANTAAGIASFGGRSAFFCTVGADARGKSYVADLESIGVRCVAHETTTGDPTGVCHVLVDHTGDRTMATHLGAASSLDASAIDRAGIEGALCLYVEGYMLDDVAAVALGRAVDLAKGASTLVALSLSDPFVVERHHDRILGLIDDGTVDLLFGNEDEAQALLDLGGAPGDNVAKLLRRPGYAFVMTRGKEGSVVATGDGTGNCQAHPVDQVVDTTGAGDLFAAGVLYGLSRRRDVLDCLRLGSMAAAEVIGHLGARPETRLSELSAT